MTFLFAIVQFISSLLGGLLVFRAWLQFFRVQPSFEIARLLVQLTQPWVSFWQTVLRGMRWRPFTASVVAAVFFALSMVLIYWAFLHPAGFSGGGDLLAIVVLVVLLLVRWWMWGLMLCVLMESLSSWLGPSPKSRWISAATAPLLNPLRRLIPLLGQLDLSPLIAFIGLNIATSLLASAFDQILLTGL